MYLQKIFVILKMINVAKKEILHLMLVAVGITKTNCWDHYYLGINWLHANISEIKNVLKNVFLANYLLVIICAGKGIQFKMKDIKHLKEFNFIQKYIVKCSVWTPKEKIINRLLFWRWL